MIPPEKLALFRHPSDPDNAGLFSRYRNHLLKTSEAWVWINLVENALAQSLKIELSLAFGVDWAANPELLAILGADAKAFAAGGILRPNRLTFGFWAMLLEDNKEKALWVPFLHKAFQKGTNRKIIYRCSREIREYRNRMAHHELITKGELPALAAEIQVLCEQLDPKFSDYVLNKPATAG